MPPLSELGRKPAHATADGHFAAWFAEIAHRLLNTTHLVVAGERYRFAELEMYYSGGPHPDPFAHRDPVQLEDGRWYFHRTRGGYRGGSFKGLDLALGDGTAYFGVLVRTLAAADGSVLPLHAARHSPRNRAARSILDGPCVAVEYLLAKTGAASVAALDGIIKARSAWDARSPLHIVEAEPRTAPVYACSRVGLSLKTASGKPDAPKFVARPYRFLTEPAGISKGKPHLVLALHRAGHTAEAIRAIIGIPTRTIDRYVSDFTLGQAADGFDGYIGTDLGTADLCKLLGTWHAKYGTSAAAR